MKNTQDSVSTEQALRGPWRPFCPGKAFRLQPLVRALRPVSLTAPSTTVSSCRHHGRAPVPTVRPATLRCSKSRWMAPREGSSRMFDPRIGLDKPVNSNYEVGICALRGDQGERKWPGFFAPWFRATTDPPRSTQRKERGPFGNVAS